MKDKRKTDDKCNTHSLWRRISVVEPRKTRKLISSEEVIMEEKQRVNKLNVKHG